MNPERLKLLEEHVAHMERLLRWARNCPQANKAIGPEYLAEADATLNQMRAQIEAIRWETDIRFWSMPPTAVK